jgi:hypothetical protein
VVLQIKGIGYYLVILAMFTCHYATIYADWIDPMQRKSKHSANESLYDPIAVVNE